jgi:hypothetical protein
MLTQLESNLAKLPIKCYSYDPVGRRLIIILRGEDGFYPCGTNAVEVEALSIKCGGLKEVANLLNRQLAVTDKQREAMENGSMFGRDTLSADVDSI